MGLPRLFVSSQVILLSMLLANTMGMRGAIVQFGGLLVYSDLDKGIEGNLDAALLQGGLHTNINYAVKNQVVTMTGEVDSQSKRVQAQAIVANVPNVLQVVNELQVKEQKATSSN